MSDLYTSTYNPDVLSCLANLSNDEVFTPPSVVNAMLAAEDSGGTPHDRFRIDAIRHDALTAVMRQYGRLVDVPA